MNHHKPSHNSTVEQKNVNHSYKSPAYRRQKMSYVALGHADNQEEIDTIRKQTWSKFKALPKISRLRQSRVASKASSGEDPVVAAYSQACVMDTDDTRDEVVSSWKPTPPSRRKQRAVDDEEEDSEDEFETALRRVQPPKIIYQQLNRFEKAKLISKLIIQAHLKSGESNQDVSIASASTRGTNSPINQDVTALVPPHAPYSRDSESIDSGFTVNLPGKNSKHLNVGDALKAFDPSRYDSSEGTHMDTDRLNASMASSDSQFRLPAVINIQPLVEEDGMSFNGQSLPFNSTEGHHATLGTASPKVLISSNLIAV